MIDPSVLERARVIATHKALKVISEDLERPWGGFLVIDEAQIGAFAAAFFPDMQVPTERPKMSPKLLVVAPHQRLSWQYHHRRSEHWRVLEGPVEVERSKTDEEPPTQSVAEGEEVVLQAEERHRLVGLDKWGIVAEIWFHTDPANPSNEDDIVRISDDYQR